MFFAKIYLFDNLFGFMEIMENILSFDNRSKEFNKYVSLKLNQKMIQHIIPLIVSNNVDANLSQKGVIL